MKKKGLHCCGFRYQHTYNGKLIEGRGNFVCISTIYDLYFLCGRIGQFFRGSNRTCMYVHVCTMLCTLVLVLHVVLIVIHAVLIAD